MNITHKPKVMFESKKIDFWFRWRWWVAWASFVPIACALWLMGIFYYPVSVMDNLLLLFIGICSWTFFEYLMHRFSFHYIGKTPFLKHLHYVIHGMHHAHPTDPERVIFPPFASLVLGGGVGLLLYFIVPEAYFLRVFSGFILGYCWYEFIHYASHQIKWRLGWLRKLKRHHLLHHHNRDSKDKNFGVTTVIWDHVFGTYLK